MQVPFLKGKRVFLAPLTKECNFKEYARWLNDQYNTLYIESGKFPLTIDALKKHIKRYNSCKDGMLFGIYLNRGSKHIGNVTLHMIDWRNRHAEIGILIGDKKMQGKGYATEVIKIVADYAFNKLNFHKLCAGMVKDHKASKRVFEKTGFKAEGLLREYFYLDGKYFDCYRLGLLRSEFKK